MSLHLALTSRQLLDMATHHERLAAGYRKAAAALRPVTPKPTRPTQNRVRHVRLDGRNVSRRWLNRYGTPEMRKRVAQLT